MATGNPDLEQETLTAFELGYIGVVAPRTTVSAAVYGTTPTARSRLRRSRSTRPPQPPPGWPLPPAFVPPNALPSRYTYLNLGTVKDKGVELGVDTAVNPYLNLFVNYSYQWMPEIEDFPAGVTINDVNWPAKNRFNVGANVNYRKWFGNVSLNYTDESYWQDVLDARFAAHGCVHAGERRDRLSLVQREGVTSLKMTNIGNQEIQQHIFGDILRRQVVGEVRLGFSR